MYLPIDDKPLMWLPVSDSKNPNDEPMDYDEFINNDYNTTFFGSLDMRSRTLKGGLRFLESERIYECPKCHRWIARTSYDRDDKPICSIVSIIFNGINNPCRACKGEVKGEIYV